MSRYLCHISKQKKTLKAKMNHKAVLISKTLLVTVKITAPGLILLNFFFWTRLTGIQKLHLQTLSMSIFNTNRCGVFSVNRSQCHLGNACMRLPCIFISL